jgi:ribosomal protein L11 methylase PrmA
MINLFLWKPHYDFPFESFLDLGCGSGFPVGLALKLGFNAYGVDNDSKMVNIARKNLETNQESPKRVVKGDYLSEEFWESKLGGISPAEFDVLYLYNWENKIPRILKYLSKKVSNKARVAVSGEQPYVASKISWKGEKGFESLGWKIDIKVPDINILKGA